MKKIITAISLLAILVSCEQPTQKWISLKVIQSKPQMSVVNLRDSLHEHGDGLAYEALLKDTAGNELGELHGWLVTVDLSDPDNIKSPDMVDKMGSLVFRLGEDDIVVFGRTAYSAGQQIMKDSQTQKRAIMGGTGKYRGIIGEVQTTRNADSSYTHELLYKMIH